MMEKLLENEKVYNLLGKFMDVFDSPVGKGVFIGIGILFFGLLRSLVLAIGIKFSMLFILTIDITVIESFKVSAFIVFISVLFSLGDLKQKK